MTDQPDQTIVLTDDQRQKIRDYFQKTPDGGYKSACRAAGLARISKTDAKALIEGDDELAEVREKALGVDEDSAWKRIATLAKDLEHKDALRANTFILGAIHGRTEKQQLELSGDPDHPIGVTATDVEQAVERFTATVAAAAVRAATATAAEPASSEPD